MLDTYITIFYVFLGFASCLRVVSVSTLSRQYIVGLKEERISCRWCLNDSPSLLSSSIGCWVHVLAAVYDLSLASNGIAEV